MMKEMQVGIGDVKLPVQEREEFLKVITVDCVKRSGPNGTYNIDCIVYTAPGHNPAVTEAAFKRACIDLFGHEPPPYISTGLLSRFDGFGIEAGRERNVKEDSFCLTVHWPQSQTFSVGGLKERVTERLYHHTKR